MDDLSPDSGAAAVHRDLAARLRRAYAGPPVPPLRDGLSAADAAGAYAVQAVNTAYWCAQGRRVAGHKVGLTSKQVQAQLGVGEPDFGVLFEDMRIADGGLLPIARVLQPKIEAEVAIVLGRDLADPAATAEDVVAAADHAVAAIEIVDSRIADWGITYADTVADNGSSAFYVLGGAARPLAGLDLYSCGMVLEVDGAIASTGVGAACLGNPLHAVAWLARSLAAHGAVLRAGTVVLTGALGPMVTLAPGNRVQASIGGLGTVSFRYEDAR